MTRREFLEGLAVGLAAGLPLTARGAADRTDTLYTLPPAPGKVTLLHFTDCHAQLLPVSFREPDENIGVGVARGRPPHLVGEALLKHFGIAPGTPLAHAFTYLDFVEAARSLRQARRLRASRHAREDVARAAAGRAAPRRRRQLARLCHGALDVGAKT